MNQSKNIMEKNLSIFDLSSWLLLLVLLLVSPDDPGCWALSQSSSSSSPSPNNDQADKRCEKITIPMCMDIGYNFTSMPNLLEMETQEEAGLEVHQFWPLVEINCSEDLKFFLCSMYAPICIEEYPSHIPSCRSVCERARLGCTPIMIQYGFNWPDKMNCSELPVDGDGQHICMDPRKGAGIETDKTSSSNSNMHDEHLVGSGEHVLESGPKGGKKPVSVRNKNNHHINGNNNNIHQQHQPTPPPSPDNKREMKPFDDPMITRTSTFNNQGQGGQGLESVNCRCDCRMPYFIRLTGPLPNELATMMSGDQSLATMSFATSYHHHHFRPSQQQQQQQQQQQTTFIHHFNHSRIETANGMAPWCAVSCKGALTFDDTERDAGLFWIGVAALVCIVTCLLTVLTFLTDSQRFRYPERAIIFLAACYIFIAGGYLLRLRFDHSSIACDGPFIRYQRTGPTPATCVLSFLLLYFFGMASAYWWLILTLTWFLAAGLKWSSEAITGYAQYFHLLAWLLPTTQSVAILCLGAIDGDPFAGVCSVGNQSRANLLIFVITPLCVCIAIGVLFLLTGFVALFRIRRAIRQTQHTIRVKTNKLEKLMIRIGLSSFLYIVPEMVVVACHIYEYTYRPLWEKSLTCKCQTNETGKHQEKYSPQFALILLKYIMSLTIGITSGFWIWSTKTLDSWMKIYLKISCCSSPFGSPASSRSGASQLLPNYYGRGMPLNVNGSSLPMTKTQVVNLGPISLNSTPQHHAHLHHMTHHDHVAPRPGSMLPPSMPPPLPPPPPPMMMSLANSHHHGGSLNGSQFTHMIGSTINSTTGPNANSKIPLSHV